MDSDDWLGVLAICVAVAVIFLFGFAFGFDSGIDSHRQEAVDQGFAEWSVDDQGDTKWSWKMTEHKQTDPLNPPHYKGTGYECIETSEDLPFNLGNAFKYQFRAGSKLHPGEDETGSAIIDLEKCQWYLRRELQRVQRRIESLKSLRDQSSTSEESPTPSTEGISSSGSGTTWGSTKLIYEQQPCMLQRPWMPHFIPKRRDPGSTNATSDPRNP